VMYRMSSDPASTPTAAELGTYSYDAPLSYHGHELAASARFLLSHGLDAFAALRYEYRGYWDDYSAAYTGGQLGSIAALPAFDLPPASRADHRLTLEGSIYKTLPHRLTIELGYRFVGNFSNLANAIDNRTYTKHTVTASVGYYF
jgi:hypothetical protein